MPGKSSKMVAGALFALGRIVEKYSHRFGLWGSMSGCCRRIYRSGMLVGMAGVKSLFRRRSTGTNTTRFMSMKDGHS